MGSKLKNTVRSLWNKSRFAYFLGKFSVSLFAPVTFISSIALIPLLTNCEKEIEVKLPDVEQKVVIEGRIEQNGYPYVILTRSVGYFEPTDLSTFENLFVHNATVTVTVEGSTYDLPEICLNDVPPALLPFVAEAIGIPVEDLQNVNYCVYTSFSLLGKVGKTYKLTVAAEGNTYTAVTRIPELVPLEDAWFDTQENDTLGFLYARMTDPDTLGNGYRWFARRINLGADGEPKDLSFVAPFGSVFDDKFINGKSFDFGYDRGHPPGNETDDPGEEPHYYKVGDTVVVKFCTIDHDHFEFLRQYESEVFNNGNPFASPTTIPTNIEGGGLGIWGGYGVSLDTVICK